MARQAKYRPSLTLESLRKIRSLAINEEPMSVESATIIGVIAPFLAKAENGAMAPAFVTKPVQSLEDKLGLALSTNHDTQVSKEEYWKQCWMKLEDKGKDALTLEELEAADEHRYLNDLMDEVEEAEFEKKGDR